MKNGVVLSGIVATALFALVGCGASGGGTDTSVSKGRAFYLDSAVSGINYQCGTQEGITDKEGAFTFEKGKSCTFYLGDIKLRDLNANSLEDGKKIVETDLKIAQLLQTLDEDGNPDNGITIAPEIVEALSTALSEDGGTGVLPDTEEELEALSATLASKVPNYKGHAVSEEEAKAHLEKTKKSVDEETLKALLAGKTFYAVGSESDFDDVWYGKATFNESLTSLQYAGIEGGDAGSVENESIKVDGKKIVWLSDNSYTVVGENKGDYIELTDYETNGELESHTRLYFDKTKAEAHYKSLASESSKAFEFTTDYLNGKTLFFVQYDDFGYDDMKWNMARMNFSKDTFTWTEYDTSDTDTHTFRYRVNDEGNVQYWDDSGISDDGHTGFLSKPELEDDYIKVCEDGDCNTYLFFDEAKAKAFRDGKNSSSAGDTNTSGETITAEMLKGKTFYDRDTDDGGYARSKMTIDDNLTATRHEIWYDNNGSVRSDDTFSFALDLIDGKIRVDGSQFDEGYMWLTLESADDNAWTLGKAWDKDMDGEIDEVSDHGMTWYLAKPDDFPESL